MTLQQGQLGVHPPGALGVAFFVHAQADCFIGRVGDGISDLLKDAGYLRLDDHGEQRSVSLRGRIFSNLLEAAALGRLPEVLLVCCNPDQLDLFTATIVKFVENLVERGRIRTSADVRTNVPILLILPNGILAEQTQETYLEQLRESLLMGRLAGTTDDVMTALLDRLVRGVSLQAGGRRGGGIETVYVLERKGWVLFAGGGEHERERVEAVLGAHDYPFQHARGVPATRIEFDKAMISIVLNVGGLIHVVRQDGDLVDLRMGDLCKDPTKQALVDEITRAVFNVGKAAGAYSPEAEYEEVWSRHRATILAHEDHVTSSIKMLRDRLAAGLNSVRLFSNEDWILTPLCRYAATAGLAREEELFRSLRWQVQEALARAIRFRQDPSRAGLQGREDGRDPLMKLTAQRNFTVEAYDAGDSNMLLIGTMLDNEHLIKLEVNVCLTDEQITRSRLQMIRVPFPVCREVESVAENLVGLRIQRGVINEIGHRVGGRTGCSHIKELATNIVYFAASHLVRRRTGVDPLSTDFAMRPPEERFTLTRQFLRDSCLAYCQATPQGLDERIGVRRVGVERTNPLPLGAYEPSLGVVLRERVRRWGEKVYFRYRTGSQETALTWDQFGQRTFQVSRRLIAMGVRPGDRLMMLSENRLEMWMTELAAMSIGAVSVPVFAGYPAPQVAYVLGHARPRFVIVSGNHQLEKIERQRFPWVEGYYCIDFDAAAARWGALDFAALVAEDITLSEELNRRICAVQPDDCCMVMYTSGTTGPPKGVMLCHRNLISQQKALSLILDAGEKDVLMCYLPWHHSFGGLFERCLTLYQGCQLCLDDSRGRDIDRMIDNWRAYDPTLFFSVPRVHDLLMVRCREDKRVEQMVFGGRLRWVFTAGASLPARVAEVYRKYNIPVLEGWGLTETSPCATLTPPEHLWRDGYVGFPIPGVSVRIDADQEILVKGPNVMLGYYDDEEATSHVLIEDGWFRTGDLGEFTPDGLRVLGRRDGAFKLTTGEKVHPHRIENILVNESPFVNAALALGSGQDLVAAVLFPNLPRLREWAAARDLPSEGLTALPEVRDLYAREMERINPLIDVKYYRIRRAILADHELSLDRGELTPSGKIVRKAVLASFKPRIDAMFASSPPDDVIVVNPPEAKAPGPSKPAPAEAYGRSTVGAGRSDS